MELVKELVVWMGLATSLIALFIKLTEGMRSWSQIRGAEACASRAKSRLERLKLRYEIEALKRNANLEQLDGDRVELDFPQDLPYPSNAFTLRHRTIETPPAQFLPKDKPKITRAWYTSIFLIGL